MRVTIGQLYHMERGQGFVEAVMGAGKSDGLSVEIEAEVYEALLEKYPETWRGLGDLVAALAKPIAKAVGLEDCEGCAKRQEKWNAAVPFGPKKE